MKKLGKKGKKAGASPFALGMVLGVIVLIGIAWASFSTTNRNINAGIIKINKFNLFYDSISQLEFYINESAKLSASQAFYETIKNINENSDCSMYGDYPVLSDGCFPKQELINNKFIEEYNKSFYNFLLKYPKNISNFNASNIKYNHFLDNKKIKSIAPVITLNSSENTTFAIYNLSYDFDPSVSTDLEKQGIILEDLKIIFQRSSSSVKECKEIENNKDKKTDFKIEDCIKEKLEKLNLKENETPTPNSFKLSEIKKEGSYLIFKFKTKKYFFFEDEKNNEKFLPISLNFALNY